MRGKVLTNKDLSCQEPLKDESGLRAPSPEKRTYFGPGIQVDPIVADGELNVCDGAHRAFVMKDSRIKTIARKIAVAGHFWKT